MLPADEEESMTPEAVWLTKTLKGALLTQCPFEYQDS